MQNRNKGITLVALIITIVVMLILVAVSVNVIIKSNLIGTAEKTVDKYKTASEEEANGGTIEINGKEYASIEDYIESTKPLPNIEAGVRAETNISAFRRSAWTANAETGGERTTLSTSYTEPNETNDTADKTGIANQIANLTKSIYKYGGFYIGRYEAGSKTPRTSSSGVTTLGIKQDMYPYNYVKWGDSMSSIGTTGAVYLSNSLYNTNEYGATSMLCTGACWDSMLDFIKDSKHSVKDSTTWGNYKNSETFEITRGSYAVYDTSNYTLGSFNNVGSKYSKMKNTSILLTTGATERNCSKNIYDVAGNCYEWTTESNSSSNRVYRGRQLLQRWF